MERVGTEGAGKEEVDDREGGVGDVSSGPRRVGGLPPPDTRLGLSVTQEGGGAEVVVGGVVSGGVTVVRPLLP